MGFIFTEEKNYDPIALIHSGTKTQTRRVIKPGEKVRLPGDSRLYPADQLNLFPHGIEIEAVYTPKGKLKYEIGRDYALMPGRGFPAVIEIDDALYCVPEYKDGDDWFYRGSNGHPYFDRQHWGSYREMRIRLLRIRREMLNYISIEDSRAEGAPPDHLCDCYDPRLWYQNLWDNIPRPAITTWRHNPLVLVYVFEKMEG